MCSSRVEDDIVNNIDEKYLIDTLVSLAKIPTNVPLGAEVFMEPDDPKLLKYVQGVLKPKILDLGVDTLTDVPRNQLLVKMGNGDTDNSLILMAYTPTQHHNLMQDPFSGKIADGGKWGYNEKCVFGQGVTQNKAHQAILMSIIKLLIDQEVELSGTLYMAINNEGRSSHECSSNILNALNSKPLFGIILCNTGLRLSLGNRGRVDVNVEIRGEVCHSSAPKIGLSAIDGAHRVMDKLKLLHHSLESKGSHPLLGKRHAIVYQLLFDPIAPHTLPEIARIRIDRRLLPGDDPDQAVKEVRDTLSDMRPYEVNVSRGECMLPALVDPKIPSLSILRKAHKAVLGTKLEEYYGQGSFDAGGPCSAGVPTVMYGVGGGSFPVGDDYVPISQVINEAKVISRFILGQLG
jgi:acetylornithine deacetylase/succinyl-diaminopimelate desuccinylase-like protein